MALAVGDHNARAIHVLDAGGDERDRVPHQIDKAFHSSLFAELASTGPISCELTSWWAMPAAMVERRFGVHQC